MAHDAGPMQLHAAPGDWIGLDVGGANLKVALADGRARSTPFELWRRPNELTDALVGCLPLGGRGVALTMTGELADCFATKADGVRAIVRATATAAGDRPVRVATIDDRWLTPHEAESTPHAVAAANWRVAARWCAQRWADGLWIDIGSTTIDLIPFAEGRVVSRGCADTERLVFGELLYLGVRRTPICALVDRLPFDGRSCPVAAEVFATTVDAWTVLGQIDEDANDTATADGRPRTKTLAAARLARMVCADPDRFTQHHAQVAAEAIADASRNRLTDAVARFGPAETLVLSGEGAFVAEGVLPTDSAARVVSIAELTGADASRALPAYAAAVLASHELGGAP